MNKERFKCRVWDKVELRFIEWFNADPHIMVSTGDVFCHERTKKEDGTFGPDILTNERWEKDELVIQQFTGLLDKNGKEIYEGDVLSTISWSDKHIYTVVWDFTKFTLIKGDYDVGYNMNIMTKELMKDFFIVGNIFEGKSNKKI